MKLPRGEEAIVDVAKLRDYCLNTTHPRGRHKARVFASALGLTAEDAWSLGEALLRAAREEDAIGGDTDAYGQRYIIDLEFTRNEKRATIRSAWIIRRGEELPRLTTCYVRLD